MKKLGIILTPDNRSKAYLQKLLNNKILLDEIIFMNDKRKEKFEIGEISEAKKYNFDITKSVKNTLMEHKLNFKEFDFVDINNIKLINYLEKSQNLFIIFTGGGILRKEVLRSGPKFIHLHPGLVEKYKGSTCFYYSILNENNSGVTAFIMNEGLDTGDIILQKKFLKPDHKYLDNVYDPHIRSETLIEIIKLNKLEDQFEKQKKSNNEVYYIIHPVLKHIAILNCVEN
tara:strand:- start:1653 stop:2339 length:687 start_codon:yes stop_codon:yes gene_type:complete